MKDANTVLDALRSAAKDGDWEAALFLPTFEEWCRAQAEPERGTQSD